MNDYEVKRLQRDIESSESFLKTPIKRHLITNALIWGLFMGPLVFFITRYEKEAPLPWEQLPIYILLFAVVGGVANTFGTIAIHKWQLKKLKKKLNQEH